MIRWLIARIWRWRVSRRRYFTRLVAGEACNYCAYTRWCFTERGVDLGVQPHGCPNGNGGPLSLPAAKVHR